MIRTLALALTAAGLIAAAAAADEPKPAKPAGGDDKPAADKPAETTGGTAKPRGDAGRRDPEMLFKRLDKNGDGKVSKEEFKEALSRFPKLAERAELADKLFERLDENKDGFLSPEEFKKARERLGENGKIDPEKLKKLRERFGKP